MPIDYRLAKVVIRGFRGIEYLEIELREGFPTVLIGANNAGKSTVLNAIALALNGGGSHQWTFSPNDFFCDEKGVRVSEFLVQVHFNTDTNKGYPAVKGISKPTLIQGTQVKGVMRKDGRIVVSKVLIDGDRNPVTMSTRTPLAAAEKKEWAEHDVGYRVVNAKLEDIFESTPEVWLFKPQNIEASLYQWKTGPIAKLSKLLASRFLEDNWVLTRPDGGEVKMPATLHRAYDFMRSAAEAFPFWRDDMKPRLEGIFGKYVGAHAKIDLRPDILAIEEWLAQRLAISLATDTDSVSTPLNSMGDGWQSVIRLAALEALAEYPDLVRERVVLLMEEPETHLHPHLRRKIRKVLSALAAKGWTVIYTTHSSELVSFDENQVITRLMRRAGTVDGKTVHTDKINPNAKLQSKLDERGAHDFLFGNATVLCEGKDDSFSIRLALEQKSFDCDARSISITQCGSVTAIPAFAEIASALGIRWCAITDQDLLPDGTVKPVTEKARGGIERAKGKDDLQLQWPGDLEGSLGVTVGKATPEVSQARLADPKWETDLPKFMEVIRQVANWADPSVKL